MNNDLPAHLWITLVDPHACVWTFLSCDIHQRFTPQQSLTYINFVFTQSCSWPAFLPSAFTRLAKEVEAVPEDKEYTSPVKSDSSMEHWCKYSIYKVILPKVLFLSKTFWYGSSIQSRRRSDPRTQKRDKGIPGERAVLAVGSRTQDIVFMIWLRLLGMGLSSHKKAGDFFPS